MSGKGAARLDPEVLAFIRRANSLLEQGEGHYYDESAYDAADGGGGGGTHDDGRIEEVVDTVVAEVKGHELACACHVFANHTLQRAIAKANPAQLVALASGLLSPRNALLALSDKYASHVLEALLVQVLPSLEKNGHADENEDDEEQPATLASLLVTFVDSLLEDRARALLTAMKDRYATYAIRGVFRVLAGLSPVDKNRAAPRDPKELYDACCRLLRWPYWEDGSTLESAHEAAAAGKEGAAPPSGTSSHIVEMACDRTGSHVVEAVISSCSTFWRPLYAHVFKGRLLELARHQTGNHAVQALVGSVPNGNSLGFLLKELTPSLHELLQSRPAVALKMAQMSLKHHSGGKELVKATRQALVPSSSGGGDAKEGGAAFALAVLAIGARPAMSRWNEGGGGGGGDWSYEGGGGEAAASSAPTGPPCGTLGSLLMQALVAQPSGTSDSLIQSAGALSQSEALSLARHPAGSRALEAALSQGGGAAAARQRLALTLGKSATKLARDKSGSFLLEAAFKALPIESRGSILESLQPLEASLRASHHGGTLLKKLRYDHWRHHPESWQKGEQRARTAVKAFADILSDETDVALVKSPKAAGGGGGGGMGGGGGGAPPKAPTTVVAPVDRTADASDVFEMDAIFGNNNSGGGGVGSKGGKTAKPRKEGKKRRLEAEEERQPPPPTTTTDPELRQFLETSKKDQKKKKKKDKGEERGGEDDAPPAKPKAMAAVAPAPSSSFAGASKMAADRAERIKAMLAAGSSSSLSPGGGGGGDAGGKKKRKFSMA